MSILELSRQAMRGDAEAMSRLIRSLADDFYVGRPARLESARADLERALQEYSEQTPARKEIAVLWELTHVFLSKVPASLGTLVQLGSDAAENALLELMPGDAALHPDELCARSHLGAGTVRRGLRDLERLGLVAAVPGDALVLTRDGRQAKRWMTSQRSLARDLDAAATDSAPERAPLRIGGDGLQMLAPREVRELEAKVEPRTEIWVVGVTSPGDGAFLDTVRDNLRRGVQYFYLCPEAEFRALWSGLEQSLGADSLRGLACIAHAPALLRLNSARLHVLPGEGRIRSLRACWLEVERREPLYLALSTPTALDPNAPLLDAYARAARRLIARSGDVVLDFEQLEAEVR